jgi:hypothetical protein
VPPSPSSHNTYTPLPPSLLSLPASLPFSPGAPGQCGWWGRWQALTHHALLQGPHGAGGGGRSPPPGSPACPTEAVQQGQYRSQYRAAGQYRGRQYKAQCVDHPNVRRHTGQKQTCAGQLRLIPVLCHVRNAIHVNGLQGLPTPCLLTNQCIQPPPGLPQQPLSCAAPGLHGAVAPHRVHMGVGVDGGR